MEGITGEFWESLGDVSPAGTAGLLSPPRRAVRCMWMWLSLPDVGVWSGVPARGPEVPADPVPSPWCPAGPGFNPW